MSEHFDPSEQETKELLPEVKSSLNDDTEDTNRDPEGAEKRAMRADIQLPDYWYKKYALDDFGKPTFNKGVVNLVMQVFDAKYGTNLVYKDVVVGKNEDGSDKVLTAEEQTKRYESTVNDIVTGIRHLLIVDPQSTGLNFLQLTTRTWSEFVSICYEYSDSMSNFKEDDIPDWLVQREEKMLDLGRKARMLSSVLEIIDNDFGLKDVTIQRSRVQSAVEQRMQRLAEWNFNRQADMSGKVKREMNAETQAHMQSIVDNA
tara:strand:- start:1921 stop:2697 length:777 start_codon:yes stop_codon:yes gene_type:complete